MNKESAKEHKKHKKDEDEGLEDCISVMHPEMARNYEEDDPCNDGTKTKGEDE